MESATPFVVLGNPAFRRQYDPVLRAGSCRRVWANQPSHLTGPMCGHLELCFGNWPPTVSLHTLVWNCMESINFWKRVTVCNVLMAVLSPFTVSCCDVSHRFLLIASLHWVDISLATSLLLRFRLVLGGSRSSNVFVNQGGIGGNVANYWYDRG